MKRTTRTGIDLSHGTVRLVRGEGGRTLESVTHIGDQAWNGNGQADPDRAADALAQIIRRLGLNRWNLGRIAASVGGQDVVLREVLLPTLSEEDLRRALPYEAKKSLFLEDMTAPVLDCQILGPAPPAEEGGPPQMRVLLAAVPRAARETCLAVFERAGLQPDVLDPEPLARLNALHGLDPFRQEPDKAVGLLHVGAAHASFSLVHAEGDLFHRTLGSIVPGGSESEQVAVYAEALASPVLETMTFYRGRFRREIGRIFLTGKEAILTDLDRRIQDRTGRPIEVMNPLHGLALSSRVVERVISNGPSYAVACGLCRWWDEA